MSSHPDMRTSTRRMDVEAAIEDLKNRTLARMPGEFARLVYLASTRDYNTGQHHHEGLAFEFTREVAERALTTCHREIFDRLLLSPLDHLLQELEIYISSTRTPHAQVLEVWQQLEPYRVTIPLGCDQLSSELFISNVRIALAILQDGQGRNPNS